jgi:hypothetical protein
MKNKVEMSISFGPWIHRVRLLYPNGKVEFFDVKNLLVNNDWKEGCTSRSTKDLALRAIHHYNKIDLGRAEYEFICYL